jgi:O-antigen/teichoic acid export membrane protein
LSSIKNLASQTAVYGFSHIAGRLLNYLLVPLYVRLFAVEVYGITQEFYAYITFFMVLFTYGMETAFFRFSQKSDDKETVYSTAFVSLFWSSLLLAGLIILFSGPLSEAIRYPDHRIYVIWCTLILYFDALAAIPFAMLRQQNRAFRFALLKLLNIIFNIGFNLFFLLLCPYILREYEQGALHTFVEKVYDPSIGVGYVFISNLLSSFITVLLLLPDILGIKWKFSTGLWKELLRYSLPLIVVGLAGMVNETLDRILIKFLRPESVAMYEVGIYGACYKISILMTLFVQAFKFAAEPFFFAHASKAESRTQYAVIMKYFVITCSLIFLWVMMNLSWIKHFIDEPYFEGLHIVPVLLIANLFLGIYYNLSVWYKLVDKTMAGAWISIGGAVITIVLNAILIPRFGYTGAAWATLVCYFTIALASYWQGKNHFPVDYEVGRIGAYILAAVGIYLAVKYLEPALLEFDPGRLAVNNLLVLLFAGTVYFIERPRKTIYS